MSILDVEKLPELIAALAPGFLIMFVRRQFAVGKPPSFQDRAVTYVAISAVYFAVAVPLFQYLQDQHQLLPQAADFFKFFGLPVAIGLGMALLMTRRTLDRLWQWIGLKPIHHIPSAWDYVFGKLQETSWVIIILKDGSQVAGRYDADSFASSDCDERDLYISDVWEVSDEGVWSKPKTAKGILLCGADICTVEIFRM